MGGGRQRGESPHGRVWGRAARQGSRQLLGDVLSLLPAPSPPSSGAGAAAGLLVTRQERHAGEGLGTGRALVLLGVGVRLQVGPEIGAVGEGPATVRTAVGLLTWGRKGSVGQGPSAWSRELALGSWVVFANEQASGCLGEYRPLDVSPGRDPRAVGGGPGSGFAQQGAPLPLLPTNK